MIDRDVPESRLDAKNTQETARLFFEKRDNFSFLTEQEYTQLLGLEKNFQRTAYIYQKLGVFLGRDDVTVKDAVDAIKTAEKSLTYVEEGQREFINTNYYYAFLSEFGSLADHLQAIAARHPEALSKTLSEITQGSARSEETSDAEENAALTQRRDELLKELEDLTKEATEQRKKLSERKPTYKKGRKKAVRKRAAKKTAAEAIRSGEEHEDLAPVSGIERGVERLLKKIQGLFNRRRKEEETGPVEWISAKDGDMPQNLQRWVRGMDDEARKAHPKLPERQRAAERVWEEAKEMIAARTDALVNEVQQLKAAEYYYRVSEAYGRLPRVLKIGFTVGTRVGLGVGVAALASFLALAAGAVPLVRAGVTAYAGFKTTFGPVQKKVNAYLLKRNYSEEDAKIRSRQIALAAAFSAPLAVELGRYLGIGSYMMEQLGITGGATSTGGKVAEEISTDPGERFAGEQSQETTTATEEGKTGTGEGTTEQGTQEEGKEGKEGKEATTDPGTGEKTVEPSTKTFNREVAINADIAKYGVDGLVDTVLAGPEGILSEFNLSNRGLEQFKRAFEEALVNNPDLAQQMQNTKVSVVSGGSVVFGDKGVLNLGVTAEPRFGNALRDAILQNGGNTFKALIGDLGGANGVDAVINKLATGHR